MFISTLLCVVLIGLKWPKKKKKKENSDCSFEVRKVENNLTVNCDPIGLCSCNYTMSTMLFTTSVQNRKIYHEHNPYIILFPSKYY